MTPAGPASVRPGVITRLSLHRKTASLYLPLFVIVCAWLLSLLSLPRLKMVASSSLPELVQHTLVATVVTWGVVLLLLKLRGEGLGSIGLDQEKWRKSLIPGVLFGLGSVALEVSVLMPLAQRCWPSSQAPSLKHWFEGPAVIPLWLFLVCIAAPKEELERSFILTRFEKAFGRKGLILSLVLQPVMFGICHLYQGQAGAAAAGSMGFIYALIYLRRRSCWEAAIAHSTYDMVMVGLAILTLRANPTLHH